MATTSKQQAEKKCQGYFVTGSQHAFCVAFNSMAEIERFSRQNKSIGMNYSGEWRLKASD
ncbi:hypothetical protein [Methylobacter sp. BBA5.1]|jgi:hypothetical protein|uniref:hypothetical protein n=1 Tax=Methylobacter sp. BBA5.1 TaxID=1495064 RepID=UPI0003A25432|nr:hypothetical protein [Methylobacter sp. BBA5.1]